ncbi:hypothetical protein OTK51_13220 [Vibrio scophthalmi]|uniref:hypothetical protein n=1 Tax=Vibrio scophthalmi TaxID=45658 RepID=UPI0022839B80|nr:hypothetical protein [Vibrio scophthalmi]MCY9804388.1 hypothetical protein [Vibrio scophthalmi]
MYKQNYLKLNCKAFVAMSCFVLLYIATIVFLNSTAENYFVYKPNSEIHTNYHSVDDAKKEQIDNAIANAQSVLDVVLQNELNQQGGSND